VEEFDESDRCGGIFARGGVAESVCEFRVAALILQRVSRSTGFESVCFAAGGRERGYQGERNPQPW